MDLDDHLHPGAALVAPPAPPDDDERIAAAMARLATGDRSACWDLLPLARPGVGWILRDEARRLGVTLHPDELDGLVLDVVTQVLPALTSSWQPGRARPWRFGRQRVVAVLHRQLGLFAASLDALGDDAVPVRTTATVAAWHTEPPLDVLHRLAATRPDVADLEERLRARVSARDAALWLDVRLEQVDGNRAPAVTVGTYHALSPAAVRKVVQRVNERLAA